MNNKTLKTLISGAIIAAAATFGGNAMAQETSEAPAPVEIANGTAFGDWLVRCEAVTTTRTACRLTQELSLRDGGDLIARFIVLAAGEGEAVMLAQVPMGVYLPGGAVLRVADRDDLEQREMIWQRCWGELCEAAIPLDAEAMADIAEADQILFGYRMDPSVDPIIVSFDVSQLPEAIEAVSAQ